VTETLAGHPGELKERAIAIRLFHRDPDYNAAEDSIVRVQAREVRNRLTRYYEGAGHEDPIRISLPVGSYQTEVTASAATTTLPAPEPHASPLPHEEATAEAPARLGRRWMFGGLAAALGGAALVGWKSRETPWQSVWQPVTASNAPVLIASGKGSHWSVSPRLEREISRTAEFPKRLELSQADLTRTPTEMMSLENAQASGVLMATLRGLGVGGELRIFNQLSSRELKQSPIVLLGAFNNTLTMELMPKLRYRFEVRDNKAAIVDSRQPERAWMFANHQLPGEAGSAEDFAMVARLLPANGPPIYVVAGIYGSGTLVAADFLSQPGQWETSVRSAPAGWENGNFQILLKTLVTGRSAHPPEIIATHFWR
jgi:hypothetical protein